MLLVRGWSIPVGHSAHPQLVHRVRGRALRLLHRRTVKQLVREMRERPNLAEWKLRLLHCGVFVPPQVDHIFVVLVAVALQVELQLLHAAAAAAFLFLG